MKCRGNNLDEVILTGRILGGLGISLSDYFRMQEAQADQSFTRARRPS